MKRIQATLLCAVLLAAVAAAQQQPSRTLPSYRDTAPVETKPSGKSGYHIVDLSQIVFRSAGTMSRSFDMAGKRLLPQGRTGKHGLMLWNNLAVSAWWATPLTGYLNLDWGELQPTATGLPGEVIDGFTFSYGTNNMDPAGETIAIHYFDSCTGWGNKGVEEAAFLFTGLPNAYTFGSLSPGWGWTMEMTVDLEDSGYEFLLNGKFGQGFVRLNTPTTPYGYGTGPATGYAEFHHGNGPTGTEHAFDTYYPNGVHEATWFFCSGYYVWCTWPGALYGPGGPAAGMTYYGAGAAGNDSSLYTAGGCLPGDDLMFLLRRNGSPLPGWLFASLKERNQYLPALDVTRLIGNYTAWSPIAMGSPGTGDYFTFRAKVPPGAAGLRIYFQGALGSPPFLQPPLEASNGVRAN